MKTSIAVLHVKTPTPEKVSKLAHKVLSGLTSSATTYKEPDPPLTELSTELNKLDELMDSKDGSKQKNQAIADQAAVVYALLKEYIIYVNKIAKGDKAIILLSGFDCNDEPESSEVPDRALIKRIEDGSTPCSAKIYAETLAGADRWKVEIATDIKGPWKTYSDCLTRNNLEVENLDYGVTIYVRISGGNIRGWGTASEPMAFLPR
jgi:hypothetical protein